MRNVNLHNFSSEDFTWSWNKEPFTIRKGQTVTMPEYLFEHFAKHLIDRELTKAGKATHLPHFREEMMAKCKGDETAEMGSIASEIDKLNRKSAEESLKCPTCGFEAANRAGLSAHMRKHESETVTEESFAGLSDSQKGDETAS